MRAVPGKRQVVRLARSFDCAVGSPRCPSLASLQEELTNLELARRIELPPDLFDLELCRRRVAGGGAARRISPPPANNPLSGLLKLKMHWRLLRKRSPSRRFDDGERPSLGWSFLAYPGKTMETKELP